MRSPALPSRPSHLMSRPVLLVWSTWLIASVLMSFGLHQPMTYNMDSAIPAIRLLLILMMMGLQIVWPLWSLSQQDQASIDHPHQVSAWEWLGIAMLMQFTLWPLWTIPGWTILRCIESSMIMLSWSTVMSVVLALTRGRDTGWRCVGMLGCLIIPVLIPILLGGLLDTARLWYYTPYSSLISLLNRQDYHFSFLRHVPHLLIASSALLTWGILRFLPEKSSPKEDSVLY